MAPRFVFGRSAQPKPSQSLQSQRLIEALRTRPVDEVEEQDLAEDGSEDDEMLDVEHVEALPTIENSADESRDLPFSPKRRRYSNDGMARALEMTPARPIFKQPSTPASHISAAHFARPYSVSGRFWCILSRQDR